MTCNYSTGDSVPPKTSTPYSGSLCFKGGKAANVTLFYVDYRQLTNNGNPLDVEEKNKLYSDLAEAKEKKEFFKQSIQAAKASIDKLLSAPTNQEATVQLAAEEANLEQLLNKVKAARDLKVNEQAKKQLKRQIEHMVTVWRKRRRMCVEFLNSMEEYTEGTISAKKCLSGDGPIEIDSDESAIHAAVAFAKIKKRKKLPRIPMDTSQTNRDTTTTTATSDPQPLPPPPSSSFVGVQLESSGKNTWIRVIVNENEWLID